MECLGLNAGLQPPMLRAGSGLGSCFLLSIMGKASFSPC